MRAQVVDGQITGDAVEKSARIVHRSRWRSHQIADEGFMRQLGSHLEAGQPAHQKTTQFTDMLDVKGRNGG